jgi:hypothetical protein
MTVKTSRQRAAQAHYTLAFVNLGIWAISIVALVFVIQHAPSAKGLFPMLGGGSAVGIALLSGLGKSR